MSELRVGLVCEGPTDRIVLDAAMKAILPNATFVLSQLQPEESASFGALGGGWRGVYKWCEQAVARTAGQFCTDIIFQTFDFVIIHLDADVAKCTYQSANIDTTRTDLPCDRPCPPASDSTKELLQILLGWLSIPALCEKLIFWCPAQNTEAWVLAALFPNDDVVLSGTLECAENAEGRLNSKPKGVRVSKRVIEYREHSAELEQAWPRLRQLGSAIELEQAIAAAAAA